uniref:Putative secreted protein n=1 Tax=Anopheles darlingi TaxID=43151 RepID=A0A2M4DQF2_ANODA
MKPRGKVSSIGSVVLLVCLIGGLLPGHVAGQLSVLNQIPYGLLDHLKRVPQLWNATSSSEQECLNQLGVFGASFDSGEVWALSMFDSWGKHPSGILFGNENHTGNGHKCRQ